MKLTSFALGILLLFAGLSVECFAQADIYSPYTYSEGRKVKIKSLIMSNLHYQTNGTVAVATAQTASDLAKDVSDADIATLVALTKDEEGQVRIGAQYLLALYGDKSLAELDRQMAAEEDPDDRYFLKRTRGQISRFIKK